MNRLDKLLVEELEVWSSAEIEKKLVRSHTSALSSREYGVKKLRELILELAIQGKLVPQDADDEPASELLKNIYTQKEKLIEAGDIRKVNLNIPISSADIPFSVPTGWNWARMIDLSLQVTDGEHSTPLRTADKSQIPLVTAKNVRDGAIDFSNTDFVDKIVAEKCWNRCKPEVNDILIVSVGATIGRLTVITEPRSMVIVRSVTLVKPILINPFYLALCLRSPTLQKSIWDGVKKNAQPSLYLSASSNLLIPTPPKEEQDRIVERVNELLILCERLENLNKDADEVLESTVLRFLELLSESKNAKDFNSNWKNISSNFDILFDAEVHVDLLKNCLKKLAVMGHLVAQDPQEEDAEQLMKEIYAITDSISTKRKSKNKNIPIGAAEKPFLLPKGWVWSRINDLVIKIGAGSTPLGGQQVYVTDGIPFLRSQNIWNDGLRLTDVAYITQDMNSKMARTHVYPGDLLFNITGASIGRCAIVPDDFKTGNVSQHVTILRTADAQITRFLHLVLTSEYFKKTVMDMQVGVSREGLSIQKLGNIVVPMPPKAEQKRIMEKIDEVSDVCEELKARMLLLQDIKREIASSIVTEHMVDKIMKTKKNQTSSKPLKICTLLTVSDLGRQADNSKLARLIVNSGGFSDAKEIWTKSKLDLPKFYQQLKIEIDAGYILKPLPAQIELNA